jgi:hypothetical protein
MHRWELNGAQKTIEGSLELLARDVDSSYLGLFLKKLMKCQTLKKKPAGLPNTLERASLIG